MLKKIILSLMIFLQVAMPMQAAAVDLNEVFNGLTGGSPGPAANINAPGAFASQARMGASLGGIDVKVPRMGATSPQLVSLTPPRIVAGCGGISAHFGGFSFISGQEFGNLLKQIASGAALGFVSALVMKTLCPPCEAVVQELKTAATNAAKNFRDSCEIGRKSGDAFAEKLYGVAEDKRQLCANTENETGASPDGLLAWTGVCNSITDAVKILKDHNRAGAQPGTPGADSADAATACQIGSGNLTWARLSAFDNPGTSDADKTSSYLRKLVLMNIMGAELHLVGNGETPPTCPDGSTPSTVSGKDATVFCKPPVDTRLLTALFMCGAPSTTSASPGSKSPRVNDYCKKYYGKDSGQIAGATQVFSCTDQKTCNNIVLKPAGEELVKGEGFLVSVNNLLRMAVQRVRDSTGFADPDGQKIMALISVAPYPLYQVINAAAVYPSASEDLLDSMSILVAEQYAYSLLDESLKVTNRNPSGSCQMTAAQASELLNFITHFRSENKSRLDAIGQNFTLQQAISRQINDVNLAIQQQTMSQDLLATGRMAQSINSAITPVKKVAP